MLNWFLFQITPEEYEDVVQKVMSSSRLRYHPYIYSLTNLCVFFFLLLLLCLVFVAVLENHLMPQGNQFGFEFIHGMLVWMMLFVTYIFVAHIFKMRVS